MEPDFNIQLCDHKWEIAFSVFMKHEKQNLFLKLFIRLGGLCLVSRKFEGKCKKNKNRGKVKRKKRRRKIKLELNLICYFYLLLPNIFIYFNLSI